MEYEKEEEFVDALWTLWEHTKYAIGGEIDPTAYPMPTSIQVEGAGDLALPLSHDDFLKLKAVSAQAPYGRGEQTLLDTDVRRAWQVEASKVSCPQIPDFFSKVVSDLAVSAVSELGIDAVALGLEVKLYKLLVYEQGGHFKFHRDTEKEVGMFATMILQLPTQAGHEGGQLEVRHGKKTATFGFSGAKSMIGYFKTVFFCDCEHKLAEVQSGSRLCMVFSLVRNNVKFMDVDDSRYIPAVGRVQKLLKEWAESGDSEVLAIPLGHNYSNNSLSFAGLKGYDRVVATLVLSCTSFLDVHLCMLVRTVITNSIYDDINEEEWEVRNWSTVDGEVKQLTSCSFDMEKVVGYEALFGEDPDNQSREPYNGNDGGEINSFYYAAVLVIWPKERRIKALATLQPVQTVVDLLEEQHGQDPRKTKEDFQSFVADLSGEPTSYNDKPYQTLLKFCLRHDLQDAAFTVLRKWTSTFISSPETLIAVIHKYGWDACYTEFIQAFLGDDKLLSKCHRVAQFPLCLWKNGLKDAAVYVARQLSNKEDLQFVVHLIEFFCVSGLEEETWHLWSSLSVENSQCLALVVKTWGEKSIPRIEELLEKRLKENEKSWKETAERNVTKSSYGSYGSCYGSSYYGSMYKPPVDQRKLKNELQAVERNGRKIFLHQVADLVLDLDAQGCHDTALAFARKDWIKDVRLEDLYAGVDALELNDAILLLLRYDERFHDKVRKMSVPRLLDRMRKAADLFGLKKNAKVTELFRELLSKTVSVLELRVLDTVFWLGDEKLIADIVKRAEIEPSVMDHLFPTGKLDFGEDEDEDGEDEDEDGEDEDGLKKNKKVTDVLAKERRLKEAKERYLEKTKQDILLKAKEWDVVGIDGFRKLVNARIRHFSFGAKDEVKGTEKNEGAKEDEQEEDEKEDSEDEPEEEEEEEEEKEEDSDFEKMRSKRRKLNQRIQRVEEDKRKELSAAEIEWLSGILAALA